MDLKRNIIDNLKECEIKIGYRPEDITLYYPVTSLLELLPASEETLSSEIERFCEEAADDFGEVSIRETSEKGRYGVRISKKGVTYVHETAEEAPFLEAFLSVITKPMATLEEVINVFHQFSDDSSNVVVTQEEDNEWGVSFADEMPDPYVYHIAKDDFGLEYHRFTKTAYNALYRM